MGKHRLFIIANIFLLAWTCINTIVSTQLRGAGSGSPSNPADNWSPDNIVRSLRTGDKIAAAIAQYKKDKGIFPNTLAELTPAYISQIDLVAPLAGHWDYNTYKGETFALTLQSGQRYRYYYRNAFSDDWMYADPDFKS